MRTDYERYIDLKNAAAVANGFDNNGEMWRAPYVEPGYNDQEFLDQVASLYEQLKPLYEQLHAYVRHKVNVHHKILPSSKREPIPAHLLGNMWAQSWLGTLAFTQPFPHKPKLDVSDAMKQQGWDARKMFNISNDFFRDLGLDEMPAMFWDRSMIVKPEGRNVTCHASAWDFYDAQDFRIKQCTDVTMQDLFTVHHEMGHVEYFLLYKNQLIPFRDGANDGFHEAIGDVLALSVSTPKHLKKLGLLQSADSDHETKINFQFSTALEKIAFLPFGLMMDMYRYDVFNGKIKKTELNAKWWEYVTKYQGICAPDTIRGEDFFDPGAKFHVPADVPYMRYFVSFVIQFQFHKALCKAAGQGNVSLDECDIDGSKEAGALLREALELGSSRPWTEVMEKITGNKSMSAEPMLEYFAPLMTFLQEQNTAAGNEIGWDDTRFCPREINETSFFEYFDKFYSPDAANAIYRAQEASWAYNTNITEHNKNEMLRLGAEEAALSQKEAKFLKANYEHYFAGNTAGVNASRLYNKLTKMGDSGLEKADFDKLQEIQTNMTEIYNTAKVCRDQTIGLDISKCPANQIMKLEPEITQALSDGNDPYFMLYLWKSWRDATGKHMRDNYRQYVELKNKAAKLDGYDNNAQAWRAPFVEPSKNFSDQAFQTEYKRLWEELKPLYKDLHAFVRHKLIQAYPQAKIEANGPIPAHLLGNMWAQTWGSIQKLGQLYPGKPNLDVTDEMKKQNYTALKMFQASDDFFSGLGLERMPERFWSKSMIERPPAPIEANCHASAWDFYNRQDFRIKQCTSVTMDDFITVHHEMGHVEYYLQYKDQPIPYRRGANDGFHEAIGDVLALSVATPKHLQKVNLIPSTTNITDPELDLNYMYATALDKIAFLPFGLLMDLYRYDIFNGDIAPENYTRAWWDYRVKYQGVCSPAARTENDFDPGAKYHIPADVPYMRYFISFVIQFQFHKSLCEKANHAGPLYTCDIDGSKEAGRALSKGLQLGSSEPWQNAMKEITGEETMTAQALIDFFKPLQEHIQAENRKNGVTPGWTEGAECIQPSQSSETTTQVAVEPATLGSSFTSSSILLTAVFAFIATFFSSKM